MKIRVVVWLISPFLLGAAAYLCFSTGGTTIRWIDSPEPKLEMPEFFEFGERELGETIRAPFTLTNQGNRELVIDQVKSGCSCTWLEREEDERAPAIESLRLDPGASFKLFLCIHVRVKEIGGPMRAVITFKTNDARCPEARIEGYISKVNGGVTAWPSPVAFGTLSMGSKARRLVEIRDRALHPRSVDRVISSDPESVAARLIPRDRMHDRSDNMIALCEVVLCARKVGPIEEKITVYVDNEDRPPHEVPITAQVVSPIELLPSVVVLPRVSSNRPLYSAECSCRSRNGEKLILTARSVPSELQVRIIPGVTPDTQNVRIEWIPGEAIIRNSFRRTVHLEAQVGIEKSLIEIPILCRNDGERQ